MYTFTFYVGMSMWLVFCAHGFMTPTPERHYRMTWTGIMSLLLYTFLIAMRGGL